MAGLGVGLRRLALLLSSPGTAGACAITGISVKTVLGLDPPSPAIAGGMLPILRAAIAARSVSSWSLSSLPASEAGFGCRSDRLAEIDLLARCDNRVIRR